MSPVEDCLPAVMGIATSLVEKYEPPVKPMETLKCMVGIKVPLSDDDLLTAVTGGEALFKRNILKESLLLIKEDLLSVVENCFMGTSYDLRFLKENVMQEMIETVFEVFISAHVSFLTLCTHR